MDKGTQKFLDAFNLNTLEELQAITQEAETKVSAVVPTGIPVIDETLLRIGGIPVGRLIELFGEPDSHKSTFTYRMIAAFQAQFPDKHVLLIDTENVLGDVYGLSWVIAQGVDPARLHIKYMNSAEETVNLMQNAAKSGLYSLIVLDSLGNLEVEVNLSGDRFKKDTKGGGYKTDKIGEFARRVGDGIKVVKSEAKKTNTSLWVVNQVRSNLDPYGLEFLTPGGNVFHHNRDISIHFSPKKDIAVDGLIVGKTIGVSIIRSKVCPKARTSTDNHMKLFYSAEGQTKANIEALVEIAISEGVMAKKGSWISWRENSLQGIPKWIDYFLKRPSDLGQLQADLDGIMQVESEEFNDLYTEQGISSEPESG